MNSPPFSIFERLTECVESGLPVALATIIEGDGVGAKLLVTPGPALGTLGNDDLDRVVTRDALGELAAGSTGMRHYGPAGEAREEDLSIFIESFAPPPRMYIFGAVDFTASLVRVAKLLGYHVTVGDARAVFATKARFPHADEIIVDWPQRVLAAIEEPLGQRDAVCVLTHDARFDVPAIIAAAATNVGYLGAMGSRRTNAEREALLVEAGMSPDQLARLHSPIGLDLGARTPEETAVSICAEIIQMQTGRSGGPLRHGSGAIH
ncbi:MAG: XdhC/CoxI family protein [Candidatus Microthrix subdominans]